MRRTFALLAILLALSHGYAKAPEETAKRPKTRTIDVNVSGNESTPKNILRLECPEQLALSGEKEVKFTITVVSLIKDGIFLVVKNEDFRYMAFQGTIFRTSARSVKHFGGSVVSHDEGLLKRLQACFYDKEGTAHPDDSCIGKIDVRLNPRWFDTKDLVRAEGTIDLPISGYFRSNGKSFCTLVEIPITVVK